MSLLFSIFHSGDSYYQYSNSTDIVTIIISVSALIISGIAALVAIRGNRIQKLTFENNKLIEIARTCNSYLVGDYQVYDKVKHRSGNIIDDPIKEGRASSIVTAIENAENSIKIFSLKHSNFKKSDIIELRKTFYLHLHSSIKVILVTFVIEKKKGTEMGFYFQSNEFGLIRATIHYQLQNAVEFLKEEINETILYEESRNDMINKKISEGSTGLDYLFNYYSK